MSSQTNTEIQEEIKSQINLKICYCGCAKFEKSDFSETLERIMDLGQCIFPILWKCTECNMIYELKTLDK